jgi:hypothetical protein
MPFVLARTTASKMFCTLGFIKDEKSFAADLDQERRLGVY